MRNILLLMIIMAFTVGCAVHGNNVSVWEKDGVTPEQEQLDLADCEFQAKAHTNEGSYSPKAAEERYRELRDMCLKAKGYKLVSREFVPND